jgi:predicted dehydrogenase
VKRALVIGSGSIAKRHIRNLKALAPSAEIICVSSSGRKISVAEVGPVSIVNDLNEAILSGPDLAIIASPSSHHLCHARKCLDAAIPVLIEKPLCSDFQELDGFDLCQEGRKIGIAYNLRFLPAALFVKEFIESDRIGRIHTVFCQVGQYLPDWRPGTNYKESVSAQKALGGGALLELSHELDYLNWFFGNFDSASAVLRNSGALGIDVEENVDAILTSKLGIVCHLHLDFLQRPASRTFKAMGENGLIQWDLIENQVTLTDQRGNSSVVFSDSDYDRNDMYVDQLGAFVSFCNGDGQFHSGLESATEVMQLIAAIRQADDTGNRVCVGGTI